MLIRSSAAVQEDYDGLVRLSKERQEPVFLTREGDGEMVLLPLELWERREAELDLLEELLEEEDAIRNGARTYSVEEMDAMCEEILRESSTAKQQSFTPLCSQA